MYTRYKPAPTFYMTAQHLFLFFGVGIGGGSGLGSFIPSWLIFLTLVSLHSLIGSMTSLDVIVSVFESIRNAYFLFWTPPGSLWPACWLPDLADELHCCRFFIRPACPENFLSDLQLSSLVISTQLLVPQYGITLFFDAFFTCLDSLCWTGCFSFWLRWIGPTE